MNSCKYKRKFAKLKVIEKRKKAILAMNTARIKVKIPEPLAEPLEVSILEGARFVNLKSFAKNLKCIYCRHILDLEKANDEKRRGLESIFTILCNNCKLSNEVSTSTSDSTKRKTSNSNVNTAFILGAVHSGSSYGGLEKILACMDVPMIGWKTYKRYEAEVGQCIEMEAKASCQRSAEEEKKLVLESTEKILKELPPNIVEEIYPHLHQLHSSVLDSSNAINEEIDSNNSTENEFDAALGSIVNIIVSYDMGWSKRGNGKNYDSLNGYGTIIGFLSGKILDYATRNRKCRRCDLGQDPKTHFCRKNFVGSAKAMEADAGAALINNSPILKEVNTKVRVVIGDDDSSTISAIRKNSIDSVHKLSDKNHLIKNFSKDLYTLAITFKDLKKVGVINHIKKLFSYAVSQNKGNSQELANVLRIIPQHLFQQHENCGSWCQRKNNNENHTIKLAGEGLFRSLLEVFMKYANNSEKFSVAASSQANESVNNIIAHKNPKNRCYSLTASSDFRVASAICNKNDGETSILSIKNKLHLSPDCYTKKFVSSSESRRRRRAFMLKSRQTKLRRIQLAKYRQNLRISKEKTEGVTYKSNSGMSAPCNFESNNCDSMVDCSLVYFDLETAGLARSDQILQIGGRYNDIRFSVFIKPTQTISEIASKITGLTNIAGDLYLHNKIVTSCLLKDALLAFKEFLTAAQKPVLLVAHNANFDATRLIKSIVECNLQDEFNIIGFTDTLKVFKRAFPERKGPGMFKLSQIASDMLGPFSNAGFHDALYDVDILQKLIIHINKECDLVKCKKNYNDYVKEEFEFNKLSINLQKLHGLKKIVSRQILKKIAQADLSTEILLEIYNQEGEKGIVNAFTEKVNDKPKITKCTKVINKIVTYLKTSL